MQVCHAHIPVGWPGWEAAAQKVCLIVNPEAIAPWDSRTLEMQEQPVCWAPQHLSFSQHGGIGQESGGQAWRTPTGQHQKFFLLRQVECLHLNLNAITRVDMDAVGAI